MKLWRISQTVNTGWDTYDSAVVAAETKEAAKLVHPDERATWKGQDSKPYGAWADVDNILVEYIGEAAEGVKEGVICASFNAG